MKSYRPEVDGLRAVAVLPVAFFHAGVGLFRGGFVGVDVFFVISGYLITSIVLEDLRSGRFSLLAFYERRVRRILPPLFLVMGVSCIVAYLWMLPKDLESFGKSLIATSLFAGNLWELHAGGYWALPAQFKPLMHTWSLAIEEQFYLLYPLALMALWSFARRWMVPCLLVLAIASLCAAQAFAVADRQAVFYLLPTRAWELLMGALVATRPNGEPGKSRLPSQALSAAGLSMILFSVVLFDRQASTPGLITLIPTGGTALVLLFASERTMVGRMLATPVLVTIGLLSYSLYLWHYPVYAFARIYCVTSPSPLLLSTLLIAIVPIAYLSWRFVETPARSRRVLGRPRVFAAAAAISLMFVGYGYYLHKARGIPSRLYPNDLAVTNDLYIEYNAGAFRFKKDSFDKPGFLHVLVVGNSFARDVVNMTIENFDLRKVEIVYRVDLDSCLSTWRGPAAASLLQGADVIVTANRTVDYGCVEDNLSLAATRSKKIFYIGTKYFGDNLNWLMRLDPADRRGQFNPLPAWVFRQEAEISRVVPPDHYVSLLAPIVRDGRVPITDEEGRLISPDRTHLTRYGALFVGQRALVKSAYGDLLRSFRP